MVPTSSIGRSVVCSPLEFMELAGNAPNGYVFAAWVVATFVAVPLQDVPSMPNDADPASIASSSVGDVFGDDASTD